MTFGRIFLAGLALAAVFLTPGCGGDNPILSTEADEPLYRDGQQMEKQGRIQEALNAYLKLIAKRGDQAPDSHLDAGLIYFYHIKDPIDAIYYFRKFLELEPNSRQAVYVRGLIDAAKREFASTLPAQPLENQSAHLDMLDQVNRLQNENNELKSELAALRAGIPTGAVHSVSSTPGAALYAPPVVAVTGGNEDEESAPATAVVPVPTGNQIASSAPAPARPAPPATSSGRTHAVTKGDTLYSLALHYYGNRSKWRQIYAANREQLPTPGSLRIGMTLRIP
jgi:tetratricopeptide (TPR) repeat protein